MKKILNEMNKIRYELTNDVDEYIDLLDRYVELFNKLND